ncbi:MAG: molybdopterin-dependent oxidoreductase [Lentisphaerae bacterium]|nr:molybdopterin-dependent oxidoreductase [Lentisphaerota bacterium]
MYIFDHTVGRRKFIKDVGVAAAATAAGLGATVYAKDDESKKTPVETIPELAVDAEGKKHWGREAGEWIPSCCNMCGGQSGILVHVVDGVAEKIEPNHWNPNNYSNISSDFFDGYTEAYGCKEGGSICPKGNAGIMQLYDPDRIKKPLKRTNSDRSPGADPKWEEISWDKALDEIAANMKLLRDAGEAQKLLWMSEDHSFTHVQGDFCTLYGTPNYVMHSNLCDVARKASFKTVMGDDRPLADFLQTNYILLFGWNPTSAIKWVHLPRIITRAVEKGAKLVVVDPYLSDTAAKAGEWLSIRPATDGALAIAMGHVIVRDKLYDKAFVENWTVGFKEYAEYVKDKTPAWAEKITSIPADTIERLAKEVAAAKAACIDVWSGPGQHSNGVQGGRAIAMLAALVNGYERPGTMVIPDKKGNKHGHCDPDETAAKTGKLPVFDERAKYPLGHSSGVYTQMFENLAEGKGPYTPKMMMCVFQNPMMSVPGSATVAKAMSKLETLVVIDTMMSETAKLADYVLPGTTYLERYDLNTHWVTWGCMALRQPVVKPLFGQLAEYEVVAALGRRLELKDHEGRKFFEVGPLSGTPIDELKAWYEDYLSNEVKHGAPGMTLDELKKLPGAVWVDKKGTKYEKYKAELAEDKLKTAWFDGEDPKAEGTGIYDKPKDKGGKRIGTVIGGKPVRGFFTKSGKIEFFAKSLADKKDAQGRPVAALPEYTPRDWMPSAEYPFYLINWKEASHTHTRTQNNAWLLEIKPDNPLIMNPEAAKRLMVSTGDEVWVESPHGKVKGKVKVSKRIHPEVVGLQHGFGHTAMGKTAAGRGTSDAVLRPTKSDPLSGQALHKETCVRISKV